MIYISIYIFIVFGSLLEFFNVRKNIIYKICLIFLVIIAYLRSENIGADTINYFNTYNNLPYENFESLRKIYSKEMGYSFFMVLFKKLDLNVHIFFGAIASVSIYYLGRGIKSISDYPMTSILIFYSRYYHLWILSGIRQGLVYCIVIYSISLYFKNQKRKAIILIGVASFFHITALIFYIYLFIIENKISIKILLLFSLISIFINQLGVIEILVETIVRIIKSDRGIVYLSLDEKISTLNIIKRIIKDFIPSYYIYYLINNSKKNQPSRENKLKIIKLFILGNTFYILFGNIGTVASRIGYFGFLFSIFVLTYYIDIFGKKYRVLIYFLIIFLTTIRFYQTISILPTFETFIK